MDTDTPAHKCTKRHRHRHKQKDNTHNTETTHRAGHNKETDRHVKKDTRHRQGGTDHRSRQCRHRESQNIEQSKCCESCSCVQIVSLKSISDESGESNHYWNCVPNHIGNSGKHLISQQALELHIPCVADLLFERSLVGRAFDDLDSADRLVGEPAHTESLPQHQRTEGT